MLITFLRTCSLWENVDKFCTAGRATDDNMAHAHCILDTKVYKHALRICKTLSFSTATVVARTRPNGTLYVHDLSCSFLAEHPRSVNAYQSARKLSYIKTYSCNVNTPMIQKNEWKLYTFNETAWESKQHTRWNVNSFRTLLLRRNVRKGGDWRAANPGPEYDYVN